MKLLLDQNLSRRMLPLLTAWFPGSSLKVILINMGNVTNAAIVSRLCAETETLQDFLVNGSEGMLEIE